MSRRSTTTMNSGKLNKKSKTLMYVIIIGVLIVAAAILIGIKVLNNNRENSIYKEEVSGEDVVIKEPEPIKTLQIYQGDERIVAVMIDNEPGAWPHAGLQDAFIIYECIVEGGQTRMMALFKGKDTAKVGPIRSSRHYFVRYATEYDPIYTHFGWSPQAESFIKANGVNNINGMYYDGSSFWREGSGYHTSFTSIGNIKKNAEKLNYSLQGSSETPYNYSIEPYDLENGKEITKVHMVYSASQNVTYDYNTEKQIFMRSQRGEVHTDRVTKEQYYAKNLVIIKVTNYNIGDGSARQQLDSVGTGTGYYATNGKYIDITWKKASDTSKTYFYDTLGNEITLNDGLTFIQVVPTSGSVKFTEVVKPVATADTNTTSET